MAIVSKSGGGILLVDDQHFGPFTQEIGPDNQLVPKKLGFKPGSRVSFYIFKWRLCRKVVVAFS